MKNEMKSLMPHLLREVGVVLEKSRLDRKTSDGRVNVYYAFDVKSGCVIASDYSLLDGSDFHFRDCLRLAFSKLNSLGVEYPTHVAIDNFLAMPTVGVGCIDIPAMVKFAGKNGRQSIAEGFVRDLGYSYELKTMHSKRKPSFKELIDDDENVIKKYNNRLHPDQEKHKGKTRLDVLKSRKTK